MLEIHNSESGGLSADQSSAVISGLPVIHTLTGGRSKQMLMPIWLSSCPEFRVYMGSAKVWGLPLQMEVMPGTPASDRTVSASERPSSPAC
jgi:hypothetical protein